MLRSRSHRLALLPFLLSACATASGTLMPLGPDHPASADAPEVAIADPSAFLREPSTSLQDEPASPEAGEHAAGKFVCPMHPEVTSDQPGQCPKCQMKLVPRPAEAQEHGEHHHDG